MKSKRKMLPDYYAIAGADRLSPSLKKKYDQQLMLQETKIVPWDRNAHIKTALDRYEKTPHIINFDPTNRLKTHLNKVQQSMLEKMIRFIFVVQGTYCKNPNEGKTAILTSYQRSIFDEEEKKNQRRNKLQINSVEQNWSGKLFLDHGQRKSDGATISIYLFVMTILYKIFMGDI